MQTILLNLYNNVNRSYKRNEELDTFDEISNIPNIIRIFNCIAHTHKNNQITVLSIFKIEAYPLTIQRPPHLNQNILSEIQNGKVVAACNTSVKNGKIGVY